MRVYSKVLDAFGDLKGYRVDTDPVKIYSSAEINQFSQSGDLLPYKEDDLIITKEDSIPADEVSRTEMVRVTRRLRALATRGCVRLDTSQHSHSENTHLFKYIEYCGWDVLEFIKKYLSYLQPYMLRRYKKQEKQEKFICVIDDMYSVGLYIKADVTSGEEVIISFHESEVEGVSTSNRFRLREINYVPIISAELSSHIVGTNKYSIKYTIMRGVSPVTLDSPAIREGDYYIVRYRDIESGLRSITSDFIEGISSELKNQLELPDPRKLSFTSFSGDPVSSISMLIDMFLCNTGKTERSLIMDNLTTYISELQLSDNERSAIYGVLLERYKVKGSNKIDIILDAVYKSLCNTDGPVAIGLTDNEKKLLATLPPAMLRAYQGREEELLEFFKDDNNKMEGN